MLSSPVTMAFMHHELTDDPERSEAWHYFANEFLPKHETFTRENLIQGLVGKLRYHHETHFGPGSKLNPVIARKQIECYTEDYALGNLGLLKKDGNQLIRLKKKVPGPWKSPSALEKRF